jgi:phytoene synthase
MEQGDVTRDLAVTLVAQWRSDLDALYAGEQLPSSGADDPTKTAILTAWEDTLSTYHIPRNLPDELIEGVLIDTIVSRFETFDELYVYCYKVASVVGLLTSEIFGYDDPACLEQAIDLGIAMQLTNIIRDVKEDADRGRIYLPQSMMQEFGVREEDVLAHSFTPELAALLRALVAVADHAYDTADLGILHLNADSRLTVQLMSTNYRQILRAVERLDMNVFRSRARTTTLQKLAGIPRAWWTLRRSVNRSSSAHSRPETSRR